MASEALTWPPLDQIGPKTKAGLILDSKNVTDSDLLKRDEDGQLGFLGHVISWHDLEIGEQGRFRIFVHSLNRSDVRREIIAVEIERHASIFLPIEKKEAQARLNLAYARSAWASEKAFNSSLFRELPSGQIIEDHARQIDGYLKSLLEASGNVVNLFSTGRPPKGARKAQFKFNSTQKDAIILAKLYAIRSQTGTTRVAKRICEELGIETTVLYTAVRIARTKGWLTDGRKGKTGGSMTAEGEAFFLENDGPARLEQITGMKLGK